MTVTFFCGQKTHAKRTYVCLVWFKDEWFYAHLLLINLQINLKCSYKVENALKNKYPKHKKGI